MQPASLMSSRKVAQSIAISVAIIATLAVPRAESGLAARDCGELDPLLIGFALTEDATSLADVNANLLVCQLVLDSSGSLAQVDDAGALDPETLVVGTCPDHFMLGPGGPPPAGAERNGDGLVCRKLVGSHIIEVDNNSRASR